MKLPLQPLLAALLLLLPGISMAEEALPWYQVEVLVFTQQDLYGDEKHRTDVTLGYPDNWLTLEGSGLRMPTATLPETDASPVGDEVPALPLADTHTATEQPFVLLDKNAYQLGPESYTLGRAPGYRVLLHWGWRQPGLDIDNSTWVLLAGGEQYGEHHELEGSLRVVLNRYLHVQANLWHTRFGAPLANSPEPDQQAEQPPLSVGDDVAPESWPPLPEQPWRKVGDQHALVKADAENMGQPGADTQGQAWTFETPQFAINDLVTLKQSTRIQLGERTYLDHPNMGVLILVNRYENPEKSTP